MTNTDKKESLTEESTFQYFIKILILLAIIMLSGKSHAQTNTILVFVSHEETYYSEYIVMVEALAAQGYNLDIRSASAMDATSYMLPSGTDIVATANTLTGSSYAAFTAQFQDLFGAPWDNSVNPTPATISVDGSILDVIDMSNYDALVMPGGTGAQDYRVDGSYTSQGAGGREITAAVVEAVAIKLNELAIDALMHGKPILAQCHGASLPVFWRVPATSGPGAESMGYSLLKDGFATGFPEAATATALSNLDITYKADDRVTITSPHPDLNAGIDAQSKIITSRDWYPQTVAYATRALLNILGSYPSSTSMTSNRSILILHGGAVDVTDCDASNPANDIPCNYGTAAENLPADYQDLVSLLSANSPSDAYAFTVSDLNISGTLQYDANDEADILSYLDDYDVVIYYKHWSTNMTEALQDAMVSYADNGGGVISLHHGLYNDHFYGSGKDILVDELFGAQSNSSGWGASRANYNLVSSNYGHFITTHAINYPPAMTWSSATPLTATNTSLSYYSALSVFDEIYTNMTFQPGVTFGYGIDEITPLLSNDVNTNAQSNVSGFSRLFDSSGDGTVGRVVYLQPGENKDNYAVTSSFGQMIRNAVSWAAPAAADPVVLPVELGPFDVAIHPGYHELSWTTFSELNNDHFVIERRGDQGDWSPIGIVEGAGTVYIKQIYHFIDRSPLIGTNYYRLKQMDFDGVFEHSKVLFAYHKPIGNELVVLPNPTSNYIHVRGNLDLPTAVTILNSSGQAVEKHIFTGYPIDVSRLPNGIYYIIIGEYQGITRRFIKR